MQAQGSAKPHRHAFTPCRKLSLNTNCSFKGILNIQRQGMTGKVSEATDDYRDILMSTDRPVMMWMIGWERGRK